MANVNITEVRLLNVPLTNDYIHTLYFASAAAQSSYFLGKTVKTYTNFSYQRKDNIIRIPDHYDSLLNCNYVMYKNAAYSSKWFYAFITDLTYVDDGRTDIKIETDVIQTWLFDYEVKASFIEREHVDSDRIGEHTVPEKVELGGYICNRHTQAEYCDGTDMSIIVGATKDPAGNNVRGKLYNNIYSGINYYRFPNTSEGAAALETWLSNYSGDAAADAIVCMFLAPNKLLQLSDENTIASTAVPSVHYVNQNDMTLNEQVEITPGNLNGYNPINKKLLTYPYRYLLASNNAGASAVYHYEYFTDITDYMNIVQPKFRINGVLTPGCSVRLIPTNYKYTGSNDEEGLTLGKYPCLNWTSDVYTNWLTQNGVNIAAQAVAGVGGIVGGAVMLATGAGAMMGAGAIAGGLAAISSTVQEVYTHSMQPPQAQGNINSGDVTTATGCNDFHFYDMTIKKEYARIIDNYFSMFGYKVNRVKKPSFGHRENYWYTKTIDANIVGAIPMQDLQKIKACYNKGITFWYNPANIGNYTVSNLPCG